MASPNLDSAHSLQEPYIGQMASSNQSLAHSPPEANSGQMASSDKSLACSSQEIFVGIMASLTNQGLACIPKNVSNGQMASLNQGLACSPDTVNPAFDLACHCKIRVQQTGEHGKFCIRFKSRKHSMASTTSRVHVVWSTPRSESVTFPTAL